MDKKVWEKPDIIELGSAEDLVKNVDVDGSGDNIFPSNLASSG